MANHAIAAQLNVYNDTLVSTGNPNGIGTGIEPVGLIEAAVTWLTTTAAPTAGNATTLGSLTGGNLNFTTANDAKSALGVQSIISDALGSDYTTNKNGAFQSLKSAPVAGTDPAWQQQVVVMTAGNANNYERYAITANGDGLHNALAAFNEGKLVLSSDGLYVGWKGGSGSEDWHPNKAGGFWEVLLDHGVSGISHL